MRWMERGRCREAIDPDIFYPAQGKRYVAQEAKAICYGCPVNTECLDFALSNMDDYGAGRYGIWAGTSPEDRVALHLQTSRAA